MAGYAGLLRIRGEEGNDAYFSVLGNAGDSDRIVSMLRFYLAPIVLIGCVAPSAARTWTDCTGINRTEAEIIAIGDNSVRLRKTDGSQVSIPFDKLCHDDVLYLKDYVHKHPTPGGPPEPLKTEADLAADAVNAVLKKIDSQLEAVVKEDTEVRQRVAYAKVLKDLDNDIKNTTFEVYFPIENVANDKSHTLILGKPEGIDGFQAWLDRFTPKLSESEAVKINVGDAMVLKGRGRLIYSFSQAQILGGQPKTIQSVLATYNATSKQYFALCLQDAHFRIEKRITVKAPSSFDPPKPAAPAVVQTTPVQPNQQGAAALPPVFGQPTPVGGFGLTNPPTNPSPATTPTGVAPATSPALSSGQQTVVASANQSPQWPAVNGSTAGSPSLATVNQNVDDRPSRIDVNASYAQYIRSKLTREKFEQRAARKAQHFRNWDRWINQPAYDIGHNYHPVLLYAVQEWTPERRALWLYHNRDNLRTQYYKQLAERSDTKSALENVAASGVVRDPSYIDPEFVDDPDLLYSDPFVEAVYGNMEFDYQRDWEMPWTTLVAVCIFGMIVLISWSKYEGWI
jgi:hypothetical protein